MFGLSSFLFFGALVVAAVGIGLGVWTIASNAGTDDANLVPAVVIVGIAVAMGLAHLGANRAVGRINDRRDELIARDGGRPRR